MNGNEEQSVRDVPDRVKEGREVMEVSAFNFLHEANSNVANGAHYTIEIGDEIHQLYVLKGDDSAPFPKNQSEQLFAKIDQEEKEFYEVCIRNVLNSILSFQELIMAAND